MQGVDAHLEGVRKELHDRSYAPSSARKVRYCAGAKTIFSGLDWYVGDRILRWMGKKYPKANAREIMRSCERIKGRRNWREGKEELFLMGRRKVERYSLKLILFT
jgi:hypothetical protein